MNLSSMINILNEKYGIGVNGIFYLRASDRRVDKKDPFDVTIEFRVGQKDYRVKWKHYQNDFQCMEKREWADKTKPDEWTEESNLGRDLARFLHAMRFDDDGEPITQAEKEIIRAQSSGIV